MQPYLKYRARFTSSLKNALLSSFHSLAERSRIPKSRLLDEAIEDLLRKYQLGAEIPPVQDERGAQVKKD